MLVVATILLPSNLCWGCELCWKHNAPDGDRLWMLNKTSGELSEPEPIRNLVVVNPCDDFVFDHIE
jgi:hypothetical protein